MHEFIKKKHHHNYFSAISYSKIRKILDYMVKLCYNSIRDFVSNFCHAIKTVKTYMLRMFIRPATQWIFSISSELSNQTPQQKEGAYADAIKALAADDALREKYGENARRRVEENFTNEIFKNNVTKLTETL